jgi:hypothetical protein
LTRFLYANRSTSLENALAAANMRSPEMPRKVLKLNRFWIKEDRLPAGMSTE